MDKLFSSSQSTFISKRGMLDGVLVLKELMESTRQNKKGLFLFKVNFEKAFYSIFYECFCMSSKDEFW